MGFTSVVFLFFMLPLFLIVHHFTPSRFKNFVILAFSFLILFWGAPRLFIYFVGIAFLNYIAGYFILKLDHKIFKIVFILFFLMFEFAGVQWINNRNYCYAYFLKDFILDGLFISVFLMNNVSYLLDAYKNRFKFSRNIIDYFLYIFMFFKLFAGPIIPYYRIKGEIEKRHVNVKFAVIGIERLIFGLFKISVLSYEIAEIRKFICFRGAKELSFLSAVVAAFCGFFNLYFYFSGYCDVANGLFKITGFSSFENFGERIFYKSLTKFFKYFNRSFTNYFKFYIFPWAKNRSFIFRFFKYFLMMFFYMPVFYSSNNLANTIPYFFFIVFLEKLFLNRIFSRFPKILRKIYCCILVIIGFSTIYFKEKLDRSMFIGYLFGSSGVLLDRSFVFIIMFFKFLIVLGCFFCLRAGFKWFKKPKKKYVVLFRFFEKMLYFFVLFVSIIYCLNV